MLVLQGFFRKLTLMLFSEIMRVKRGMDLTWWVATINSCAGARVDDLDLIVGSSLLNHPDLVSILIVSQASGPGRG